MLMPSADAVTPSISSAAPMSYDDFKAYVSTQMMVWANQPEKLSPYLQCYATLFLVDSLTTFLGALTAQSKTPVTSI
jgi:hypothetical protein